MNKPLTIEQLRALEVGDWVWIKFKEDNPIDKRYASQERYFQIIEPENDTAIRFNNYVPMQYTDYGTKWLAYKNKEEAEDKDAEVIERIEKAYVHNIAECERCMKKVDMKHQFAMESMEEHIRKEVAKEILQRFKDEVMDYEEYNEMLPCYNLPTIAEKIEYFAKEYGVEVDE